MMSKQSRSIAVLLIAIGASLWPVRASSDDTPTPAVTLVAPTVEPSPVTVVIVSPEVPPTDLPTVTQEQSTPLPTIPPPAATEAPIPPTATARPETQPQPQTQTQPIVVPTPTATAIPVPAQPAPTPMEAPLPSPAQLRLNARLRWGRHVPASVRRWAFLIVPAAHIYHLSPNLIAAVMTMESGGDPLAWNSGSDARGLMQILHGPWDPRANIFEGARMLAGFLAQFGSLKLALAAYNAGPNAVIAYGGVPPYRETRDYVIIVRYLYDLFNHRKLSHQRKTEYRSSLKDLQRFADQRKKIPVLARIAEVHVPVAVDLTIACRNFSRSCGQPAPLPLFPSHDPFWPLGDAPDPLQKVEPLS